MFGPIPKEQSKKVNKPSYDIIDTGGFNFTINKAADALGIDRRTIKKRLAAAGTKPVSESKGFHTYFLGEIAKACFANEQRESRYEVENLGPKDRADHFMSEKRELEVLEKKRELVPYDEAAEKYAELGQTFAKFFPTFIDDLEQAGLFNIEQLEMMQNLCDQQRTIFAESEF